MSGRYARQLQLPEVGAAGQARLRAARVLVVGAGGLGCAVLQYLCAAGVGRITVVDPDVVEESNLHRQPLYRMDDLGTFKAEAACRSLARLNAEVVLLAQCLWLAPGNVAGFVADADLVVDAADSFAVTYVLSDECRRTGKPLVNASVLGLEGHAGVYCAGAPSYRAVFPDLPRQAGSCALSGVLGTAVGVMGTLQAHLALAWLLKLEPAVAGRLVTVEFRSLRFGGFSFLNAAEPAMPDMSFIAPEQVLGTDLVIDLRSLEEAPVSPMAGALRVSVDDLEGAGAPPLPDAARVVLCCRSGLRAWRAGRVLQRQGREVALIAFGG